MNPRAVFYGVLLLGVLAGGYYVLDRLENIILLQKIKMELGRTRYPDAREIIQIKKKSLEVFSHESVAGVSVEPNQLGARFCTAARRANGDHDAPCARAARQLFLAELATLSPWIPDNELDHAIRRIKALNLILPADAEDLGLLEMETGIALYFRRAGDQNIHARLIMQADQVIALQSHDGLKPLLAYIHGLPRINRPGFPEAF